MAQFYSSDVICGVIGNTLISMADGTEKQIKDIVIGDEIMSVHRDTAIITKEIVTSISSNLTERLIKIKDIYNEIIISSDQLIQIDKVGSNDPIIVKAVNMYIGGIIYVYDNKTKIVYSMIRDIVRTGIDKDIVYNIMTNGNNTYIASSYVICN